MSDPTDAIRQAVMERLRGEDIRVYDEVPEGGAPYPYVALSDIQAVSQESGCSRGSETFFRMNGWSDALNYGPVSVLASAVREALRPRLIVDGHRVVIQQFRDTLYRKDPATGHTQAAMLLRLETEPS